ncbi:MFS transporter [Gloeocapsa sp. PCC 73106]|uniref:MFS transporter n=1 Tax=Gloeocapsa sp. PCC 73106 TaxID=102232 RepID=UPI0002AC4782|nr:MFS transporter [Gloeocapsa sp. PCC 73106]ELR97302.1 nitrate/nitrite transporter [Gloeocapsa sp. PCC 73106]
MNLSFTQRLNQAQLTRPMWLLWLLGAGLIALDGFDFFIIGVAIPFIERDFGINAAQIGALAVAALAGSLVGSLTLGPITDRVGRQLMLVVDIGIFLVASAGAVLAWNIESLIAFRFLVGIAIGADYPISVSYITENVPERLRGSMVIGAFSFQAVGALLGALTGIAVIWSFGQIYSDPEPFWGYAWRWMLGIGLLLAIVVAILRFQFLLESPSYYIARGEYEEASDAASTLLGEKVVITPESDPPSSQPRLSYSALFAKEYRRRTLLASVPWFLQDIATYGIGIFTPIIIATLAFAGETDFTKQAMNSSFGAAFVDLFLILGFILAIALVDKVGRIRLQIIGFLGMATGLVLLAIAGDPNLVGNVNLAIVFAGFIIFNLLMNMGPNSTTFLLAGELFPTSIRASGAGLAGAIAKAGAILGAYTLPILREFLGVPNLMFILSGICILAAALTYVLRIETKARE